MKSMKLVIAYIRTEHSEEIMHDLYGAGIGGLTCSMVHGMSHDKQSLLYTKHPFDVDHLPALLKLEVICSEESVDRIVNLFARITRVENRGDGVLAVQDVEKVHRIGDVAL